MYRLICPFTDASTYLPMYRSIYVQVYPSLQVCPCTGLSIYVLIYLSMYRSICLCRFVHVVQVYLSMCWFICLCTGLCLCAGMSRYRFICLCTGLSVYVQVYLCVQVCLWTGLFVYALVYPSMYRSICVYTALFPQRWHGFLIVLISYLFMFFTYSFYFLLKGWIILNVCAIAYVSVCDYVGSMLECYSWREKVYMRECAPWVVTGPARAP